MGRVLPILFNTEMVRAILDGRKTVTRRVIKQEQYNGILCSPARKRHPDITDQQFIERLSRSPCEVGDVLYVRETWSEWTGGYLYKAWTEPFPQPGCFQGEKWHPSIHMPKEAARIWLKVTDVRVEHLQAMRLEGFLSEGVALRPVALNDPENAYMQARNAFIEIWNSTISKRKQELYSWDANPWVWVIGFKGCRKPEE